MRLGHLLELGVGEGFLLRIEPGILQDDDVADLHCIDRLDRGTAEEARNISDGAAEEGTDPFRVRLEGREIVLPRARLMGQEGDLRMPELANRREVLPNPRVVQELSRRRVDRRVDVHPEEHGMACEVKIVHREEIPGHQNVTERRGIIAFLHRAGGGFSPGARRVFSNGGTRLQPF